MLGFAAVTIGSETLSLCPHFFSPFPALEIQSYCGGKAVAALTERSVEVTCFVFGACLKLCVCNKSLGGRFLLKLRFQVSSSIVTLLSPPRLCCSAMNGGEEQQMHSITWSFSPPVDLYRPVRRNDLDFPPCLCRSPSHSIHSEPPAMHG